ncbi:hypothetical protein NY551_18995 [Curtobacterium flaccumfaciens pv. oortii]|uniref:hypothetical protein n=1 Tax=Curtobacterium flaccumfaciens TaxID=2035 RepID=UPI00265AA4DD|nr:hypothetical protein [Curtobacterium flaccumfaciens]MCS5524828.1 hypothetical protein [Curtobacterium flaccumfaciens pv. oortii]
MPVFETVGHACLWVAGIAAAAAIIGYVAWVRFPETRNTRVIARLWIVCALVGGGALALAVLMLV